jgi:hypothetical protein
MYNHADEGYEQNRRLSSYKEQKKIGMGLWIKFPAG